MVQDKDHRSLGRHVFEARDFNPLEVDPERKPD
jgi:hypothetical protein